MRNRTKTASTNVLVVFGGDRDSHALAADFSKIGKKFISDGYNVRCFSSLNLREVMKGIGGPIVFGRDDMGSSREVVCSKKETPFYELVEQESLKQKVLDWVGEKATVTKSGDCIILVLMPHGRKYKGEVIFVTAQGIELLEPGEVIAALGNMRHGVRVQIINEACYSGVWKDVAVRMGTGNDTLVETASQPTTQSFNHRSASGQYRCSYFGYTFVNDIIAHPESTVTDHRLRVVNEVQRDAPDPIIVTSHPAMDSHRRLTHWMLSAVPASPPTTTMIRQKSWRARFLQKLTNLFPFDHRAANSADLDLIKHYVDNTDLKKATTSRAGLIATCTRVLEGRATSEVTTQVINTIHWQKQQTSIVRLISRNLFIGGLIKELFDSGEEIEDRIDDLVDQSRETLHLVDEKLWQLSNVRTLMQPSDPNFRVFFPDAYDYLRGTVVLNCVEHTEIDLDVIVHHINWELDILQHVPLSVFEENESV